MYRKSTEEIAIERLRPWARNARTHSKKQIVQIAESIRRFGFANPVLIDNDLNILAGHGRVEAAKLLGMKTVPCLRLDSMTKEQARAFVVADNKIAANAGWDRELLAIELGELAELLPTLDLDISITGFDAGEIDSILSDHEVDSADPADEVDLGSEALSVSKPGDLWTLGRHRVFCGDARNADAFRLLMAGAEAQMVITDPPFNLKVNGHVGGRGKVRHDEFAFASGEMSDHEFANFLRQSLEQMAAACSPGSLIYCFMDWRHVGTLLQVGEQLELALRNICIWSKTTPGQGSFYRSAHEMVPVFQKPGAAPINNIRLGKYGRSRSNLWTYPGVNTFRTGKDDDLTVHPTVKPVAMITEAIKDASRRGGIVLDPFLGSGTTLLAAERVGRIGYGIEFEPKYVDVAIRRWQAFTRKDAILAATGQTFDERHEASNIQGANAEPGEAGRDDGRPAASDQHTHEARP